MESDAILIEKLTAAVERLPASKTQEVLDFVEFLIAKEEQARAVTGVEPDPGKDPILSFIGGVSHGSLAHNIDGELYGG
ncbi:MAG: DUF2281 domain-containing protein [Chloroflexi bacterium]|nr:DUF2281 domain-containing protein [Chloroflexota bacterium]